MDKELLRSKLREIEEYDFSEGYAAILARECMSILDAEEWTVQEILEREG